MRYDFVYSYIFVWIPFPSPWLLASPGVCMVRGHFVCVRVTRTWELPRSFQLKESTRTFRETECRGGVPSILLVVISGLSLIDSARSVVLRGFLPVSCSPCRLCCLQVPPIPCQCFACTRHSFPGPAASGQRLVRSSALLSTVCSSQTQFALSCCCVHKPALSHYYLCFNHSRQSET